MNKICVIIIMLALSCQSASKQASTAKNSKQSKNQPCALVCSGGKIFAKDNLSHDQCNTDGWRKKTPSCLYHFTFKGAPVLAQQKMQPGICQLRCDEVVFSEKAMPKDQCNTGGWIGEIPSCSYDFVYQGGADSGKKGRCDLLCEGDRQNSLTLKKSQCNSDAWPGSIPQCLVEFRFVSR